MQSQQLIVVRFDVLYHARTHLDILYTVVDSHIQRIVLVCVFSSHPFWTSSSLDVPAGVTQEEGHTGFATEETTVTQQVSHR